MSVARKYELSAADLLTELPLGWPVETPDETRVSLAPDSDFPCLHMVQQRVFGAVFQPIDGGSD